MNGIANTLCNEFQDECWATLSSSKYRQKNNEYSGTKGTCVLFSLLFLCFVGLVVATVTYC